MILILVLFTPFYAALLLWCIYGLSNIEEEPRVPSIEPQEFVSVIIPFRNEANRISDLAQDLLSQSLATAYFEVIWVNDHSEDNSSQILESVINGHQNHLILNAKQSSSGKKRALAKGIANASGNLIVTTDADCRVPLKWLEIILQKFQSEPTDMLILPVNIKADHSFIQSFQQLENLAVQGATFGLAANGMPISCNGANLAFSKSTFIEVGGYHGHENIASGDDLFLLSTFISSKKSISFYWSKEVLVCTNAETKIKNAIFQRLRWAGKMSRIKLPYAIIFGLILMLHSVLIWCSFLWLFWDSRHWISLLVVIGLRVAMDALLIKNVALRYDQKLNTLKLILVSATYWIQFPLMVVFSKMIKNNWKGREI